MVRPERPTSVVRRHRQAVGELLGRRYTVPELQADADELGYPGTRPHWLGVDRGAWDSPRAVQAARAVLMFVREHGCTPTQAPELVDRERVPNPAPRRISMGARMAS